MVGPNRKFPSKLCSGLCSSAKCYAPQLFLVVERLVRSSARRALPVSTSFSDDALGYFIERLDPADAANALWIWDYRAKLRGKPSGSSRDSLARARKDTALAPSETRPTGDQLTARARRSIPR